MQYDKLELVKHLCLSDTPVTLKSLINTFSTVTHTPNAVGCSVQYKDYKITGVDIFNYYRRQNDPPRPFVAYFEVKIKGLVYNIHFTSVDKSTRCEKNKISSEEEVLIYKIDRKMASTYENLVIAESSSKL